MCKGPDLFRNEWRDILGPPRPLYLMVAAVFNGTFYIIGTFFHFRPLSFICRYFWPPAPHKYYLFAASLNFNCHANEFEKKP